ncbi:S8 family peptidase [Inconstantimicrobium mannanitabidum]|uniref:Uncharacterized protein n=1 Tax=Inconstantimicrobium mannanitabidum TaxID=1604901 RepID=A0ACB5RCX8_9CLOT|nr:S8 family peptidase [Clostridium sp. TW13]GKX67113.1 hypothetical protein rsdtw13_23710 [Clostridium sp. TW13]
MKKTNAPKDIFVNRNLDHYMVQYQGDIEAEISKVPGYYVTIINDKYAIVSVPKNVEINIDRPYIKSIVYVMPADMLTLQEISPVQATQVDFLQQQLPLNLTGEGVDVAIVDSGIDYLSDEFMNENGETRIQCIWDQSILAEPQEDEIYVSFGAIYRKPSIDQAIKAGTQGKSPYDIVPTRDTIGHGTNMAGIIGAAGKNPMLKGMVPKCDFVAVKLIEDYSYEAQFNIKIPIFNVTSIFAALEFLFEYALTSKKPMVIYLPLGSSLGNHKGNGILEEFIEQIAGTSGILVVSGAGNERDTGGHTSGIITEPNAVTAMELQASPEQKYLWIDVWIDLPNIMTIDIVSPSGESSGVFPIVINEVKTHTFIFEQTSLKINYYFPEENTGDELIRIRFYNLQPGIWILRLHANYILNGVYNAWLPQRGITVGNTKFSASDPYGTLTNPGNSVYVITAAAYNQNNNNVLDYSGMSFRERFIGRVDVAAGGVNALTVAPNNTTAVVNGTSVSAAVVAGACVMLFQWGMVQGNNRNMYSQTVKAYLCRATVKRIGDIYPNARWGYGILNVLQMFESMI